MGLLLITARSADRARAEALANVTAEELIVELGGSKAPLGTLEPATASPLATGRFDGPKSGPGRALLLGVFGLFLGVGAAFAVERFDNRIRSRRAAEEVLGVPVMVEVPALPRSHRGRRLTAGQPSQFIEAYRGLRTSIDRWTTQPGKGDGHRLIVVTSPLGGEGATTTVAHLAATLGEIGRSVVVISADLRRPQLHLYFDKAREPGLTDVLRGAPDARRLADLNLATTIRGVRFVASGAPVRNPAPLLDLIGDHLRAARSLGDIVLVDAPPLLTTSDGADLARHADGVLLVVRAGHTSVGAAARSTELLERLDIPVIGAVLVMSDSSGVRT
jgi:Mrp family chromosome partitioning ATPase